MLKVLNKRSFFAKLDALPRKIDRHFAKRIETIMAFAMGSLTKKTPVKSGRAVRNYVATTDYPYTGGIMEPLGVGPIEPTNELPLGPESRRPANTAAAVATLKNVTTRPNPYRRYFITNKAPNISGLEHGELPEPPYKPRSPNGMFAVTVQEIIARLQSGVL